MFVPCHPQLCIRFSATADFKPGAYSGRNQPVIGLPHICEGIQIGPEPRQADNSTAAEESAATEEKHSAWKEHGQKKCQECQMNSNDIFSLAFALTKPPSHTTTHNHRTDQIHYTHYSATRSSESTSQSLTICKKKHAERSNNKIELE